MGFAVTFPTGAVMHRLLALTLAWCCTGGAPGDLPQHLADLKDATSSVDSCVDNDMKVRLYGDTAVVTGRGTRAGTVKGVAYKDRQILWTDIFVRKDGRWQCVASQGTVIAAQQK